MYSIAPLLLASSVSGQSYPYLKGKHGNCVLGQMNCQPGLVCVTETEELGVFKIQTENGDKGWCTSPPAGVPGATCMDYEVDCQNVILDFSVDRLCMEGEACHHDYKTMTGICRNYPVPPIPGKPTTAPLLTQAPAAPEEPELVPKHENCVIGYADCGPGLVCAVKTAELGVFKLLTEDRSIGWCTSPSTGVAGATCMDPIVKCQNDIRDFTIHRLCMDGEACIHDMKSQSGICRSTSVPPSGGTPTTPPNPQPPAPPQSNTTTTSPETLAPIVTGQKYPYPMPKHGNCAIGYLDCQPGLVCAAETEKTGVFKIQTENDSRGWCTVPSAGVPGATCMDFESDCQDDIRPSSVDMLCMDGEACIHDYKTMTGICRGTPVPPSTGGSSSGSNSVVNEETAKVEEGAAVVNEETAKVEEGAAVVNEETAKVEADSSSSSTSTDGANGTLITATIMLMMAFVW